MRCGWPLRIDKADGFAFTFFCVRPCDHRGPHRGEVFYEDEGPFVREYARADLEDPPIGEEAGT